MALAFTTTSAFAPTTPASSMPPMTPMTPMATASMEFAPSMVPASFDPYGASGPNGASTFAARPLTAGAYIRRQVTAAALLVLAAYMFWLAAGLLGGWLVTTAGASADTTSAPALTHVVEPGDTLWSIASTIDTDRDVRDVVASLADSNGGASLQPGQVINLRPAYG